MTQSQTTEKTHYEVLGVERTATDREITAAYRKLARKHHPDVHQQSSAKVQKDHEEKFKDIGEAYDVLHDPLKKRKYDNNLNYYSSFSSRYSSNGSSNNDSYSRSSSGAGNSYGGSTDYTDYYEEYRKSQEQRAAEFKETLKTEINAYKTQIGAVFSLVGTAFVSNATDRIRVKKQQDEEVTWVDRTYQFGAIAATAAAVLFTAYTMGAFNKGGVFGGFARAGA